MGALTLPKLGEPSLGNTDAFDSAISDLIWACRRQDNPVSEQKLKGFLLALLRSGKDLTVEGARFCAQLGVGVEQQVNFGDGLDVLREEIVWLLPTWRVTSRRDGAALLWRFLRDLKQDHAAAEQLLVEEDLSLDALVQVGLRLGPQWSREDIEDIALLCCKPGEGPPRVAGARFIKAVDNGMAFEFPELAEMLPMGADLNARPVVEQPPVGFAGVDPPPMGFGGVEQPSVGFAGVVEQPSTAAPPPQSPVRPVGLAGVEQPSAGFGGAVEQPHTAAPPGFGGVVEQPHTAAPPLSGRSLDETYEEEDFCEESGSADDAA